MSDRNEVLTYAFQDWQRMVDNGLLPHEAREAVFNDYELLDEEKDWFLKQTYPVIEKMAEGVI